MAELGFTLPTAGTLDVTHALSVLGIHSLPVQEELDRPSGTVRRIVRCEDTLVDCRLRLHPDRVEVHATGSADPTALGEVITRWLGLDRDMSTAYKDLATVPGLNDLAFRFPGLRVISYPDVFEALATTVIGQQVSVAAGRTLATRYVAALGTPSDAGLRAFPTAAQTTAVSAEMLREIIRCPSARAQTLWRVAHWYDDEGQYLLTEPTAFLDGLLALRGVGPWTRDYVALRGLACPNIFLDSDLVVRRALRTLGLGRLGGAEIPADARSLATVMLWAADARGSLPE